VLRWVVEEESSLNKRGLAFIIIIIIIIITWHLAEQEHTSSTIMYGNGFELVMRV
jgi:hypothetical protein